LNKHILSKEVQDFIVNYSEGISKLAFSGSPFNNVSTLELIQQIESRRKAEKKLPTWHKTTNIFYPPKLNLEQTSSEITAEYKTSIVRGESLADLTGGFGVDCIYFSNKFINVSHYEHNDSLSQIAKHNFKVLDYNNIECFKGDGVQQVSKKHYDVIYLDPSRRHNNKGKVFFLKDCEPNVPENLNFLLEHCQQLLIKTSPMLDISVGLNELQNVKEIHIVAVNNEVKELLWLIELGFSNLPIIKTINFNKKTTESFNFKWGHKASLSYSLPKKYLYEPNAAIMKSGSFELLSEEYKVSKLQKHTHLYTSNELVDFPGRKFIIQKVVPFHKKEIKKLNIDKANITTRNFYESVAQIRKKLKIKEGGTDYLFFTTTDNNEKVILVCSKV